MSAIPQHKRMAMGEAVEMKKGGGVKPPAMNPIEKAKRANGVVGMKSGGKAGKKGC